jgi:glycosyltransferase involved in cell wall biosynthesis
MENNYIVSVIIPTYNASQYIQEAIDSVLDQSYKNFEIIVVDDGSTDNTKEVLENFIKNEQIKYFYQDNSGPGAARNNGLLRAKGEFVAFLDADDIWDKGKISKQVDFMIKNDLDLSHTGRFFIGQNNISEWIINSKMTAERLIKENYIITSSVMVKVEILKQYKFNESINSIGVEDYDLWLRILLEGYKFGYLPEKLVGYRWHSGQLSNNTKIREVLFVYKNNFKQTSNLKYKFLIITMFFKTILHSIKKKLI